MAGIFLFDMDGLLLDTERVFQTAFCDALETRGHAQAGDAAFFTTLVGSSISLTQAALARYLPKDFNTEDFIAEWEGQAKEALARHVPVKPKVREVLDHLQAKGATMAVVTSSRYAHACENLERAGLLAHFSLIKGGDQVSATKPDPAPYLEAAADLGVSAKDCFAFEDSDRGITAAVRAQCTAVQVPDLRPHGQAFPELGHYIATDLHDAVRHVGHI